MAKEFDGQRDTRLSPQCLCGEMMMIVEDGEDGEYRVCDECGLELTFVVDMGPKVQNNPNKIIVQQAVNLFTSATDDSPTIAIAEWSLDDVVFTIRIGNVTKYRLKQKLGIASQDAGSRYWVKMEKPK